ncbi:MAG: hypothetical protein ABEK50_17425, partial [bacterium]
KDFDRRPDDTPEQVEGLLNDLQILGNGDGDPPSPSSDEDFPNSYHKDAVIQGKSIFDAMIDLREGLQKQEDPDGDSDSVTDEFFLQKGNARRNAFKDPDRIETVQESIGDLSDAISNVNINRSIGGARLNRLETAEGRAKDFEVNTKTMSARVNQQTLANFI